ncbi:hypothetical protein K445DRAFT_332292 [Daldinia sp. EC12]|nr:hypothetical protein F4774DRAFT_425193 [Daldinia eschscholtzii]OTB15826.1 hypothetical protein K445DRAFT_332292 [Daldinia sp. EC12]
MLIADNLILLGISLVIISLRLFVRIDAVGRKHLATDDYLMVLVALFYSALAANTHTLLAKCHGLDNAYLTDEERKYLPPEDDEYSKRVLGSKLEIVEMILYTIVLWLTKLSILAFCRRLTAGLGAYEKRIFVGIILLGITWVADILVILLACRPLAKSWQIYPDPGEACYPATSPYSTFCTLSLNVFTSLYVFAVPLPVLWMANIKLWKKMGLALLVSANCFVIAVAALRGYWTTVDASKNTKRASEWAYRVCFVAIITTNIPLLFPLFRRLVVMPLNKPGPKTRRGIHAMTVWKHTSNESEIPDRDHSIKFCPCCCEDPCLTDSDTEESGRPSSGFYSIDVEMYGDPRGHRRERMAFERR